MPRPKSILQKVEIDIAQRAHNCQHNSRHRIQRGDKRLKIKKERSWEHYCCDCAKAIMGRDIKHLQNLREQFLEENEG